MDLESSASEAARRLRIAGVRGITESATECAVAPVSAFIVGLDHGDFPDLVRTQDSTAPVTAPDAVTDAANPRQKGRLATSWKT
jgi:hypothetical protein